MCRRVGAEGAFEPVGGAGEVEDAAVFADHEVATAGANHPGDRLVEVSGAHGAVEVGVPEREDPARLVRCWGEEFELDVVGVAKDED